MMSAARALEAPAPQLLRRIVGARWALAAPRQVPPRELPAPPAPHAERRLQRCIAECSPGPML